jgi:hypothetical protein
MSDRQIRAIHQLCIRRLGDDKFNFVFIYEMDDNSLAYQEYELNLEQARAYFAKKEWTMVLPDETGRTIQVVRNGQFVGHYQIKERSLPDE